MSKPSFGRSPPSAKIAGVERGPMVGAWLLSENPRKRTVRMLLGCRLIVDAGCSALVAISLNRGSYFVDCSEFYSVTESVPRLIEVGDHGKYLMLLPTVVGHPQICCHLPASSKL